MTLGVGREGVEPSRCCHRQILSLLRLPIPPSPQPFNSTINQAELCPGQLASIEIIVYTLRKFQEETTMPTVRDMIRKKGSEVFSIDPEASVFDALTIMSANNTGALMVLKGKNVEGILSERDCVRKLELLGRTARNTKVSEIMTSKVIYVEAGQPLEECMALMIDKNIRHLPVFEGKELLGLISVRDVLKEMVDVQKFMISQLEHYITGGGR